MSSTRDEIQDIEAMLRELEADDERTRMNFETALRANYETLHPTHPSPRESEPTGVFFYTSGMIFPDFVILQPLLYDDDFAPPVPPTPVQIARTRIQALGTEGQCSVCLLDMEKTEQITTLMRCVHKFHSKCVDAWLDTHHTCPVCRNVEDHTTHSSQGIISLQ
jgi:hypothetical protein